jgi:hypothetical protein
MRRSQRSGLRKKKRTEKKVFLRPLTKALDDDLQHLSPRHLEKLVSSIQRRLDLLRVADKVGKIKKEAPGLLGKASWKEFVLLLSANRVQWFVKGIVILKKRKTKLFLKKSCFQTRKAQM